MSDDRSTFETTRARLEDIVGQVRRKDVSLEQSLDMLEEAVRLVNQCNELIDQTSFRAAPEAAVGDVTVSVSETDTDGSGEIDVLEIVESIDLDGDGVPDIVDVVDLVDTDGDGIVDTRLETVIVADEDSWGDDAWTDTDEAPAAEAATEAPAMLEDDARE